MGNNDSNKIEKGAATASGAAATPKPDKKSKKKVPTSAGPPPSSGPAPKAADAMDVDSTSGNAISREACERRGGETDEEFQLRSSMEAVGWRVHETFGVPLCKSAFRERSDVIEEGEETTDPEGSVCTACDGFLEHLSEHAKRDDGGLMAACGFRDLQVAANKSTTCVAEARGELKAVKEALTREQKVNTDLQSEVFTLRNRKEVLEERLEDTMSKYADIRGHRDRLREELTVARDEIDRAMDGRARKRAPQMDEERMPPPRQRSSGYLREERFEPTCSRNPAPDASTAIRNGLLVEDINYHVLVGIPRTAIFDARCSGVPPLAGTWKLDSHGLPATIDDWDSAYEYSRKRDCWPVHWSVYRVYWDARKEMEKDNPQLTPLQQHVLKYYRMPIWFKDVWRRMVQDPNEIKYNNAFWVTMGKPTYRDPSTALAVWMMRWNRNSDGCSFEDDYQTLNLRKVRGLALWTALMPSVPKTGNPSVEVRDGMIAITKSLWNIFGSPYMYRHSLKNGDITPALELNLEPFPLTSAGEMTDVFMIQKLAEMGLRSEDADDMYLFVRTMILAIKEKPRDGWDPEEVELYCQSSAITAGTTEPMGKTPPNGNTFVRPPGLLWNNSDDNNAFHKGLFLGEIPLDIPKGSQMSGNFTMMKPRNPGGNQPHHSDYSTNTSDTASTHSGSSSYSNGPGSYRGSMGGRGRYMGPRGRGFGPPRGGFRGGMHTGGGPSMQQHIHQDTEMTLAPPIQPTSNHVTSSAPMAAFVPPVTTTALNTASPTAFTTPPFTSSTFQSSPMIPLPNQSFPSSPAIPQQAVVTQPWGFDMMAQQQFAHQQQYQLMQQQMRQQQQQIQQQQQQIHQQQQQQQNPQGIFGSMHAPVFTTPFLDFSTVNATAGTASINAPDSIPTPTATTGPDAVIASMQNMTTNDGMRN
ncbi:hypothetical protein C8R43DRAFT_958558 [Mycena crocata]|nr:hypothetical protein C8R43DRAFT_958558 [Mycena crocata]